MMSTLFLLQPVANVIRPADCNDDRSEKILSTHKGVNSRLKDVIQKQEQTPESTVTHLACESSKCKVHKLHHRYIPKSHWLRVQSTAKFIRLAGMAVTKTGLKSRLAVI